jgi:hypothetical protein
VLAAFGGGRVVQHLGRILRVQAWCGVTGAKRVLQRVLRDWRREIELHVVRLIGAFLAEVHRVVEACSLHPWQVR